MKSQHEKLLRITTHTHIIGNHRQNSAHFCETNRIAFALKQLQNMMMQNFGNPFSLLFCLGHPSQKTWAEKRSTGITA